jgi:glucosamine--fructose-6-phosphate aminotransferase (isomerizing)
MTRTSHPYHMYDAIRGQPEAFARVVERTEAAVEPCARRLASCGRRFLVGIGTSYHAAQVGEYLMRAYAGGVPVQAVHAFDFALYGPTLRPDDAVIGVSHRGTKRYSVAALARAREAGCATVLITGDGGAPGGAKSDFTFYTVPQEQSSAHTISYATAIAVLATLADHLGQQAGNCRPLGSALLAGEIPAALRTALDTEQQMRSLAEASVGRRRIWLAGGGPAAVAAGEIALKIKETSYLQAEGMSAETMLHGPLQGTEAEDLFVLIAPQGPAQPRTVELAGAIRALGAPLAVVSDGAQEALQRYATAWCTVPRVPEPLASLTCVVPLQLFAYHLALARGTNPDAFRLNDPRFKRAYELTKL